MAKVEISDPVAVSEEDFNEYGCPYCGYRSIFVYISAGGTAIVGCGECEREFTILAEGVTTSTVSAGDFYPELQPHPRKGTPAHGKPPDKQQG